MARLESSGDIEFMCENIDSLMPNDRARIVFRVWDDCSPPYRLQIKSPSGHMIVDRVVRSLPTGEPQSPEPIRFSVQAGTYELTIAQLKGRGRGEAIIVVDSA